MFKVKAFLPLSLLLPISAAQANQSFVTPNSGPALYICQATGMQNYDPFATVFVDPREVGHEARFEVLKAPGGNSLMLRATYTYDELGTKRTAQRTVILMSGVGIAKDPAGLLAGFGLAPDAVATVLNPYMKTFLNFPVEPELPAGDYFEYFSAPALALEASNHTIFAARVKLAQAGGTVVSGKKLAVWSKLYQATCAGQPLSEEQAKATRDEFYKTFDMDQLEVFRRDASFPALDGALAAGTLVTAEGDYLAGKLLTGAKVAVAGTASAYAARAVIGLLSKRLGPAGGAMASYFAPLPEEQLVYTLDLAGTGLTVAEARAFLARGPADRAAACEQDFAYAALCGRLSSLEAQLNQGPVL